MTAETPPSSLNNHVPPRHEPYQALLESAQAAYAHGDYKVTVIMAQTAVELFTAKILDQLYYKRNIAYLKPQFEHLLINYNIGNSKVSSLYVALSGDPIHQAPFWSQFEGHVQLRNDLVHDGTDATADQARRSLDAVTQLINHVSKFNPAPRK